ncbi:DUF3891 family protein [Virgibacillus oceani]
MIVREHDDSFIMIEQNNHAHVSGEIMKHWRASLFKGEMFKSSVDYAIYKHDIGWVPFDKQPFWNDKEKAPYTFVTFPPLPKIILYKNGIDKAEEHDNYAGLLCSEHYKRFLVNNTSDEAQAFVRQEEERQQRIIKTIPDYQKELFDFHYAMVQLGDNISLYICLNEPGVAKKDEHNFFKDGIPLAKSLDLPEKMHLSWENDTTINMDPFPFHKPITFHLKQKEIAKKDISQHGLIKVYKNTPYEELTMKLTANNEYES